MFYNNYTFIMKFPALFIIYYLLCNLFISTPLDFKATFSMNFNKIYFFKTCHFYKMIHRTQLKIQRYKYINKKNWSTCPPPLHIHKIIQYLISKKTYHVKCKLIFKGICYLLNLCTKFTPKTYKIVKTYLKMVLNLI